MKNIYKIFGFCMSFMLYVFLLNSYSFAQLPELILTYTDKYKPLDTVRYEITYKVISVDTPNDTTKKSNDIHKLLIGNRISKTFSYFNFQTDSLIVISLKRGKESCPTPNEDRTFEIYKKNDTKTIDFIDIVDSEEVFLYEEAIPNINWQIQSDTKAIAGYSCQKATGKFRGREYEAWFTFDIPVSDGPYKFTGLPGLILEIYDSQSHYHFTCTSIKFPNSMQLITIRDWQYITKTTREKHNALRRYMKESPVEYKNAKGIDVATIRDGKFIINPQNYSLPYNPIELE